MDCVCFRSQVTSLGDLEWGSDGTSVKSDPIAFLSLPIARFEGRIAGTKGCTSSGSPKIAQVWGRARQK